MIDYSGTAPELKLHRPGARSFGAAEVLEPETYQFIEQDIVGGNQSRPAHTTLWFKFVIDAALKSESEQLPDAVLLTANSAVPLADTIRAFYKAQQQPEPIITYVAANRSLAYDTAHEAKNIDSEVRRLKPILENTDHTAVIDQYVGFRGTLQFATKIAQHAVPEDTLVTPMAGNWYHDALAHEVDLLAMTSSHANFMYRVGTLAAEQAMAFDQTLLQAHVRE